MGTIPLYIDLFELSELSFDDVISISEAEWPNLKKVDLSDIYEK